MRRVFAGGAHDRWEAPGPEPFKPNQTDSRHGPAIDELGVKWRWEPGDLPDQWQQRWLDRPRPKPNTSGDVATSFAESGDDDDEPGHSLAEVPPYPTHE